MIQRITVTDDAKVLRVVELFDRDGEETNDLWKAHACVVEVEPNGYWTGTLDQIPIYTVQ